MSDEVKKKKPTGVNKSSNKKRYIKVSLDVMKINKDWLFPGENGAVYANMTMHMMPEGEVDKFGNLAFFTQDVPRKVYDAEKEAGKTGNELSKGAILGNAMQPEWEHSGITPGSETGKEMNAEIVDDLPF